MEELGSNLKIFKILIGIWFMALFFSAIMFVLGLIYDIDIAIILAGVTGVLSLIGIIYSGYSIIKIENLLKYISIKNNSK